MLPGRRADLGAIEEAIAEAATMEGLHALVALVDDWRRGGIPVSEMVSAAHWAATRAVRPLLATGWAFGDNTAAHYGEVGQ